MNISKYCDFMIVERTSTKTGKLYYSIILKVKDYEFPLIFLSKDRYTLLLQSLND